MTTAALNILAHTAPARAQPAWLPVQPVQRFQPAVPVLRLDDVGLGSARISLRAYPGEIVHLGGGSGPLRLRLLMRAAGFDVASSGRCEIADFDLQGLNEAQRGAVRERHVARVLLADHLPDAATVQASLALPLVRLGQPVQDALARVGQVLEELGCASLASLLPAQLDPTQTRLALLARALACRPRLLVLEHPEHGLGHLQVSALRLALWSLCSNANTAVLISSDHPRLLASADRFINIDRGV
jgi:predicted ABC-type transport system involved in lysophospholipase L1 biosynthesis ATPase subunit